MASLKELAPESAFDPTTRTEILSELSAGDRKRVTLLYEWDEIAHVDDLTEQKERFEDYYIRIGRSNSKFLRRWGVFDRDLRTGIANGQWPTGMERMNIVEREKALDNLRWEEADRLRGFDVFGLDSILAYLIKLGIVERWSRLDAASGREMYNKLVNGLDKK